MESFLIAAVVGVFIGVLSGMLGIGGGTVMVPVLRLGFAMTAIQATATSLFAIIPTSIAGFITHIRNRTCCVPVALLAGLGGACMSPVGVYLASISPGWAIMAAAAAVIAYSAYTMFRKAMACPKNDEKVPAAPAPASAEVGAPVETTGRSAALSTESVDRIWRALPIGLIAGIISGYVGVGGGFIMVPLFISILGISMKRASGTSLMAILLIAIPATVEQGMLGNIDYLVGIALACGSIPGAIWGANLTKRISERRLRFIFAFCLLAAAVLLLGNELSVG